MKELTILQKDVLARLRKNGFHFLARDAEDKWTNGQTWYIDSRAGVPTALRQAFEVANKEATAGGK
jgi:hypothetical protein